MRKGACMSVSAVVLTAVVMALAVGSEAWAADAVQNISGNTYLAAMGVRSTLLGYKADEGTPPSLNWTSGNLGKAWIEGHWVPYQLILETIPPGLAGLDSIVISYDFTRGGDRFVDLVRAIQVGTVPRDNSQGWPAPDSTALPTTTMEELRAAQEEPNENVWAGFALIDLPHEQINRNLDGSEDMPPGADRHVFKIYRDDLLGANVDPNASTLVIYFQLHVSRTFVWQNQLQEIYNTPPTDDWGGYLYDLHGWPDADPILGSGYVPGSSGHVGLESLSGGKTVPIPIPEELPGAISGTKFNDFDANGTMDGGDTGIEGWRIYVSGAVEGIPLYTSVLTDAGGAYMFPNLTSGATWTIKEASQREVPPETGYFQTYPLIGTVEGQGTAVAVGPPPADAAPVGWAVVLTTEVTDQPNINFGNSRCEVTITCPADVTIECDESNDPSFTGEPTAEGNCPPFSFDYADVIVPGPCPDNYTIERTWTVTDDSEATDQCVQLIVVEDTTPPVITCPPDNTFECDETIDFGMATATDNCDEDPGITWDDNTIPGDCPQEYTVERTWTAQDDCGNTASCVQRVYVVDTTPPVITCPPDNTFECDETIDFGMATATDNCDEDPGITWDDNTIPGDCPQAYTVERTWTAQDGCGNTASCVQRVYVVDTTPPVITCPPDNTFECDETVVFGNATATDNCDLDVDITYDDVTIPGDCPQEYTVERTWTGEDDCGNTASCVQRVYVVDTTPPVITCPPDNTFECDETIVFGDATATDNCDLDVDITYNDVTTPIGPQEYIIERTWTAEDDCGNTDSCVQTITVIDDDPPEITCPPDKTFECDETVVFGMATAVDDCDSDPDITWDDVVIDGDCPQEYMVERTWTATDAAGNSASCVQLVYVVDTTAPTLTCAADGRVGCNEDVVFTNPIVSDNCDPSPTVDIVTTEVVAGPGSCEETHTRIWVAYDACENYSAECSQSIIRMVDEEPPVITPAPDDTLACNQPVVFPDPEVTDNCDTDITVTVISTTIIDDPETCMETWTRCWEALDDCNNRATACQTLVRMVDEEPPELVCADDKTVILGEEWDFDEPTVTDNCLEDPPIQAGEPTVTEDPETQAQIYTQCWTAADLCGNVSQCCQTVTVELPPPPYCTFRCWNWVADCLPSPNDVVSTIPACIRDMHFDDLYPGGMHLGIEGSGGYSILLTSPQAVEDFGCSYGIPKVLTRDYVDPMRYQLRGVLAGEIMALQFNRDFSCNGYLEDLGYPAFESCYGNYVIPDVAEPADAVRRFAGLTVDQFLVVAHQALGGNTSVLTPYGANIDHLWAATAWLNSAFSECEALIRSSSVMDNVAEREHRSADDQVPEESRLLPETFALSLQPNPLHDGTTVGLALPAEGNVSVEIFDVQGRRIVTLVNEYRPAGYHSVVWNGVDAAGARVSAGVYFCRVRIDGSQAGIQKMIKLQ